MVECADEAQDPCSQDFPNLACGVVWRLLLVNPLRDPDGRDVMADPRVLEGLIAAKEAGPVVPLFAQV